MKLLKYNAMSCVNKPIVRRLRAGGTATASEYRINGRRFVQRGALWIDRSVENMPRARRVRIRFDSREYFQLLSRYPKVFLCLSGARNLHLAVEDTIYEIHE